MMTCCESESVSDKRWTESLRVSSFEGWLGACVLGICGSVPSWRLEVHKLEEDEGLSILLLLVIGRRTLDGIVTSCLHRCREPLFWILLELAFRSKDDWAVGQEEDGNKDNDCTKRDSCLSQSQFVMLVLIKVNLSSQTSLF